MNSKNPIRVYVDTSVFGGCFDEGFEVSSSAVFDLVREGMFALIVSDITLIELNGAPKNVQDLLAELPPQSVERVILNEDIEKLRDSYLEAGVVGPSSNRDAAHIASATIARADLIVSWNFKHIVHFDKIKGYHEVNKSLGYPEIPIHSPPEVI
jgi:hypothetical protein